MPEKDKRGSRIGQGKALEEGLLVGGAPHGPWHVLVPDPRGHHKGACEEHGLHSHGQPRHKFFLEI